MGFLAFIHFLFLIVSMLLIIALSVNDVFTMRLPNKFTVPLGVIGLLNAFLAGPVKGFENLLTALVLGFFVWLIAWMFPAGLGLGDVKFIAALSAFFGYPDIVSVIFFASLASLLVGVVLLFFRKIGLRQQMPFGPFLGLGTFLVICLHGTFLLSWIRI